MKLQKQIVVYSFLVMCLGAGAILQAQDHPLIKSYEGSKQGRRDEKAFDEVELTVGVEKAEQKNQKFEGKITKISYSNPANRSSLEVFRNYQEALKAAGFQTLFSCNYTDGCGGVVKSLLFPACMSAECRYVFGKLGRSEGDVYIALGVDTISAGIVIVEAKPMDTGMVTVNAAALASDITRTGHVAIYGIFFDTGKADVKPESEPTLTEIAKLIQQDANLKVHVVGHTDSTGDLAMNMDLSRRRANAVVQALATKHGIAAARLKADGVGPLAPVASNDAEEGRAKNRRVELVKQ